MPLNVADIVLSDNEPAMVYARIMFRWRTEMFNEHLHAFSAVDAATLEMKLERVKRTAATMFHYARKVLPA